METFLKKIPIDKWLHALVCYFITTSVALLSGVWWAGVAAAFIAAIGKEVYDYKSYGHFCHWDILADIIGIIIGFAILVVHNI